MRARRLVISGVLLACVAGALAGPLNSGWVRSDAAWVVHLDVEAGARSTLGRYTLENASKWGVRSCDEISARTGMDISREILGVTIFGTECDGSDAVAIVHTTAAIDSVLDKLRSEEPTFRIIESGGRSLDCWTEHGSERYGHVLKRGGDERIIIVGRRQAMVESAIERLESQEPQPRPELLATMPREGSVVFIAAGDLGPAAHKARAALVRKMQQLRIDAGEAGDEIYADMLVTTASEQDAREVFRSIDGSIAVMRVIMQGEPRLAPLVEATSDLNIAAEGATVTLNFRHDSAKALEVLKKLEPAPGAGEDDAGNAAR